MQVVILIKIYKPYAEVEGVLSTPKQASVRMEAAIFRRTPTGPIATTEVVRLPFSF